MVPATRIGTVLNLGAGVTSTLAVVQLNIAEIDGAGIIIVSSYDFAIDTSASLFVASLLTVAVEAVVAILVEWLVLH